MDYRSNLEKHFYAAPSVFGIMPSEVGRFYCKWSDLVNGVGIGPISPLSPIGPIDPTEVDFYLLTRRDNRPAEPLGRGRRIFG